MKILKAIWQFCSYLFWPQWGNRREEWIVKSEEWKIAGCAECMVGYFCHFEHAPLSFRAESWWRGRVSAVGMKNLFVFSSLNRNFALSLHSEECEVWRRLSNWKTFHCVRLAQTLSSKVNGIAFHWRIWTSFIMTCTPSDTTTTNLPERFRGVPL